MLIFLVGVVTTDYNQVCSQTFVIFLISSMIAKFLEDQRSMTMLSIKFFKFQIFVV